MSTTGARDKLIQQLCEFIPDELECTEGEAVVILTSALATAIVDLKKAQGILMVQLKLADDGAAHIAALERNKSQLSKLVADYNTLGGDTSEPEPKKG